MSRARPVYEDDTVFVTRRCHRREYLLTPNDVVRNLFGYLAVTLAQDYNLDLYSIVVEPNHYHANTQDHDARLPDFTRDFHSFSARALNRFFNDEGSVWNSSQTSHVSLEDAEAVVKEFLYSVLNPVKDGLVENIEDYPGLCLSWLDGPVTFTRPPFWFNPKAKRKDGSQRWRDEVTFDPQRPPIYEDLSDDELAEIVEKRLEAQAEAYRAEHEGGYIGAETLKSRGRHERPATRKPPSKVSPQVAGKRNRRIARLILNQAFRDAYERALRAFIAGDRDVVFPYGTYKMRVLYGVNVAPRPT